MSHLHDIKTHNKHWLAGLLWLLLVMLFNDVSANQDVTTYAYDFKDYPPVSEAVDASINEPASLRVLYHRKLRNTLGITESEQRLVEAMRSRPD